MNNFQIAWLVAGAIIGWFGIELFSRPSFRIPYAFNAACAFVGALVAYTIVR